MNFQNNTKFVMLKKKEKENVCVLLNDKKLLEKLRRMLKCYLVLHQSHAFIHLFWNRHGFSLLLAKTTSIFLPQFLKLQL